MCDLDRRWQSVHTHACRAICRDAIRAACTVCSHTPVTAKTMPCSPFFTFESQSHVRMHASYLAAIHDIHALGSAPRLLASSDQDPRGQPHGPWEASDPVRLENLSLDERCNYCTTASPRSSLRMIHQTLLTSRIKAIGKHPGTGPRWPPAFPAVSTPLTSHRHA